MRIKPRYRVLCFVLAGILMLGLIGLLVYRADWRFRLGNALRIYPKAEPKVFQWEHTKTVNLETLLGQGAKESGLLLLVNREHPLPADFTPVLAEYNGARMHPEMVNAYIALRDEVERRTGQRLYVSSDYRTAEEQAAVLADSAPGIAAPVGCSEHEAGLALDVYVKGYGGMSIIKTRAGREMAKICADYGFIIRYPAEKEAETGTPYEPWHLRYVGRVHASYMAEHGLCYEEYLALLTPGKWFVLGNAVVGRFPPDAICLPDGRGMAFSFSRDNTGYYIVTVEGDF